MKIRKSELKEIIKQEISNIVENKQAHIDGIAKKVARLEQAKQNAAKGIKNMEAGARSDDDLRDIRSTNAYFAKQTEISNLDDKIDLLKQQLGQLQQDSPGQLQRGLEEKSEKVDMNAANQLAAALSTDSELVAAVEKVVQDNPKIQGMLQSAMQEAVDVRSAQAVAIPGAGSGLAGLSHLVAHDAGLAIAGDPMLAGFATVAGGALVLTALGILAYNSYQAEIKNRPDKQI